MKHLAKTIAMLLFSALFLQSATALAQDDNQDQGSIPDSLTMIDSTSQPDEQQPPQEIKKPYERVVLHIDTVTNLVTYKEIVEQEETSPDSFYVRAKKFLTKRFKIPVDKKGNWVDKEHRIVRLDSVDTKIVLLVTIPAFTTKNKYNRIENGKIQFLLTLIFKDDRYKYIIDNFVHIGPQGLDPKQPPTFTYFEYYLSSNVNVKGNDGYLRTADEDIKKLISDIKKYLKNPIQIDEDDF